MKVNKKSMQSADGYTCASAYTCSRKAGNMLPNERHAVMAGLKIHTCRKLEFKFRQSKRNAHQPANICFGKYLVLFISD